MITFCWTYPRTRSTVFEKCMSTAVHTLHEPFSGCYYKSFEKTVRLEENSLFHKNTFSEVVEHILETERTYGNVFIKELAYCVIRQSEFFKYKDFFKSARHIFLLRKPRETISSLAIQMNKVYGDDPNILERIARSAGVSDLSLLLQNVFTWRTSMLIIHSEKLVTDPKSVLEKVTDFMEIPYSDKMLHWRAESLPDWGIWENNGWHDEAKRSTGFKKTETEPVDEQLYPLIWWNNKIYEELLYLLGESVKCSQAENCLHNKMIIA